MKRILGWSWVVLFISAFLMFILQTLYCHLVKCWWKNTITIILIFFQYVCTVMAAMLHYSVISMFCWMLIEGFHLYIMLVKVFRRKANFRKYLLFGWGTFNVHAIIIKYTVLVYYWHSTHSVSILINWFVQCHVSSTSAKLLMRTNW